jgi:outer membrane protein assembly factor BamB
MLRAVRLSVSIPLVAVLVLSAAPAAVAAGVSLGDGVVVDAGRGAAYMRGPDGTMSAVELAGGRILWTTSEAAKPVAAADGSVVAQIESAAGSLDLVGFDAGSGRRSGMRASVELPEGVSAIMNDHPNRSFRVSAVDQGGVLLVSWQATGDGSRPMQGFVPAVEEGGEPLPQAQPLERSSGAAHLDLDSGAVSPAAAPAAVAAAMEHLPAGAVAGASGNLFSSADGRHVLASERQASSDPFSSYRWRIYDRAGGPALGELSSISSSAPFVVTGGRLVYLSQRSMRPGKGKEVIDQPMSIRAFDLASGKEAWSVEVADPSFRGPFPP